MPVIYMKHPIHGTKVATMDLEADEDEKSGWVRYNPLTQQQPEAAEPESVVVAENHLPRRGRPRKDSGDSTI